MGKVGTEKGGEAEGGGEKQKAGESRRQGRSEWEESNLFILNCLAN